MVKNPLIRKMPKMTGNTTGGHSAGIVNSTPTNDTDLVNKAYVDNIPLNVAVDLFSYNEASDIATYLTMKAT